MGVLLIVNEYILTITADTPPRKTIKGSNTLLSGSKHQKMEILKTDVAIMTCNINRLDIWGIVSPYIYNICLV